MIYTKYIPFFILEFIKLAPNFVDSCICNQH